MGARLGFVDVLRAKLTDVLPPAAPGRPGVLPIASPAWLHCLEPMRVASAGVLHQRYPHPASAAPAAAGIPMESTPEPLRSGSPVRPARPGRPAAPVRLVVRRSRREQVAIQCLNRLGATLDATATDEDVRGAYRQLVRESHPDRHAGADATILAAHTRRLRAVVQAWDAFQGRHLHAA